MLARFACLALLLTACASDDSGGNDGTDSGTAADTAVTASATDDDGGTLGGSETGPATGDATAADSSSGAAGECATEFPAIITDIDETLTLSDGEFLMQLADGTYDPLEREGGAAMVTAYADLGYRVLYLTARSETLTTAGTDEPARDATMRWLVEHGYPTDEASTTLILAPSLVFGDDAAAYKTEALMDMQSMGWRFDYAYGNADSDIAGYDGAGLDKATTFIIGPEAGNDGTVAVEGEDWLAHTAEHLPTVPAVCE